MRLKYSGAGRSTINRNNRRSRIPQDKWVRSMGLDTDGTLFVDMANGIRLYDVCLNHSIPEAVSIRAEDLMKAENRSLYFRFHSALNEISELMLDALYDRDRPFKDGEVVVDAGARIGVFAAKISAAVGERGTVIAIEPEPKNYACLLKNIRANRLHNVVPVRKMLWSERRRLNLYLSAYPAAHSAYRDPFFASTGTALSVEADSLDTLLEDLGIDRVNFIKMDIEGAEAEALKGMKRTLESDVQMAIAAYHPVEGHPSLEDMVSRLATLGFQTTCADGIVRARRQPQRY